MSTFTKINCLCVLMFLSVTGYAQDVKMYSDTTPSAEEMGTILFSRPQQSDGMIMRSISFVPHTQNPAIGLPIKFGFDSAQILEQSIPFVDEIGRMLNLPDYANNKLVIEGHTDSRGSEQYNRSLSKRRANAVKHYLMETHRIASNQLVVTGLGESRPLSGISTHSSINRRVQFRQAP